MNVAGSIASEKVTTTESTAAVLGATRGRVRPRRSTARSDHEGDVLEPPVAALPARSVTPVALTVKRYEPGAVV